MISNSELFFQLHKLPIFTRFALFSLSDFSLPFWLPMVSLMYSELQVFGIFFNTAFFTDSASRLRWLNIFHYVHEVTSVGDLIDYQESSFLKLALLVIICIYVFGILALLLYLLILLKQQKNVGAISKTIWSFCCYLHPYLLFYPIHFSLVKFLAHLEQDDVYQQGLNTGLQVVVGIALFLNFAYTFMILLGFQTFIKTSNPISTKTSLLNFLIVGLKTFYPFVWFFFSEVEDPSLILVTLNLCFSIIRDSFHFYILPYYKFQTLKLATGAYAITTLLAITTFIGAVSDEIPDNVDSILAVMLWVLFVPLYAKFYLSCLDRISLQILLYPSTVKNMNHLVSHWHIYKYFSRYALRPSEVSGSYKKNHLVYKMYMKQLEKAKSLKLDNAMTLPFMLIPVDYGSLENQFFVKTLVLNAVLDQLKAALKVHPKTVLLEATLAVNYIKTKQLYLLADRHIQRGLQTAGSFSVKNSLYLMRLEIIKKLNHNNHSVGDHTGMVEFMDVQDSIASSEMLDVLKQKIRAQIKPQLTFWSEFKSHKVELFPLIHLSKQVGHEARGVQRYWNYFHGATKMTILEPLLIMGIYASLILENDRLGRKYFKKYFELKTKSKSDEMKGNASGTNMLSKQSMLLAISGQPRELGKILRCYNGVRNKIGLKVETLVGKSINTLMPAFYRARHNVYLQVDAHPKTLDIMEKTREVHALNSEGYLVPCFISILLSFMPESGLCYFAMMEPMKRSRRVVLFDEEGRIMHFTKNFQEDMVMGNARSQKDLNIYDFCTDLYRLVTKLLGGEASEVTNPTKVASIDPKKKKTKNKFSPFLKTLAFGKAISPKIEHYRIPEKDEEEEVNNSVKGAEGSSVNIEGEHKLLFTTFAKDGDMFHSETLAKSVSTTTYNFMKEIAYKATFKVHSNDQGRMVEIVMERIDKTELGFKTSFVESSVISPVLQKRTQILEGGVTFLQPTSYPSVQTVTTVPAARNDAKPGALNGASVEGWTSLHYTALGTEEPLPKEKFERKRQTQKDTIMQTLSLDFKATQTLKNEVVTSNPDVFSYRDTMPMSPGGEDRPFLLGPMSATGVPTTMANQKETMMTLEPPLSPLQSPAGHFFSYGNRKLDVHQGDVSQPDVEDKSFQFFNPEFYADGENRSNFQSKSLEQEEPEETPNEEVLSRDKIGFRKNPTSTMTGSSVTTNREERARKVVRVVLSTRKLGKVSVSYIVSFILTMLLALGLMLWFSLNAPNVSNNIQAISDVLQTLQLRSFATNLCNQESRLGASMNTIAHDLSLFPSTLVGVIGPTGTITQAYNLLNGYSVKLQEALGYASKEIQDMFHENNVRLYERDENGNKVLIRTTNNINAIEDILSNGFLVASYPYPDQPLAELPRGFRFVFDNSVDDLLVVAEDISDVLFQKITDSCDGAKDVNVFILITSLMILCFFAGVSLYFVIKVNRQFFRFMNVLITLPVPETEATREQLYMYDKILNQDFEENEYIKVFNELGSALMAKRQLAKTVKSADNFKGKRQNARSIHADSLTAVYRQNYMSFLQVILGLMIVGACLVTFFVLSQSTIGTLHAKQINMNTVFQNINQQSLLSVQLQSMVLDNDTTTIRNQPIAVSFDRSIGRLKEVQQLQEALQDSSGQLPDGQRELLYDYPCSEIKTQLFSYLNPVAMNRKCLQVTNGRSQVGLSSLLPMMANNLEVFNTEFWASDRTTADLTYLYILAINMFLSSIDVSVGLFAISYDETSVTVQSDLDKLTRECVLMAIAAVLVSLVISTLIWILIVRRMVNKQFDIKQVLSLVPTGLIIESMHLRGYLMEISRAEAREIQKIERF